MRLKKKTKRQKHTRLKTRQNINKNILARKKHNRATWRYISGYLRDRRNWRNKFNAKNAFAFPLTG